MKKLSFKKRFWIPLCALLLATLALAILYFAKILPEKREEEKLQEAVRAYRAAKLEQYERENAAYDDYDVDVAFIGDSLTDGYDLAKYYPQYVTANRGIGGDTTFGLEERLQVSLYDLKPKVVVMLIGANNMDSMFQNYESILQSLQENLPESKIVLLSLTAMGGEHWGRKNQLAAYNNVSIKLLAQKYNFTFVDLYSALYDVSIGEVYEGYTIDGGHFTHEGYTVVTAQITPVLKELLGK
jgi:lysophospholipase L1-like esterase